MKETTRRENSFTGYEYKDVTVRRDMEALYADSFPSFGWQLEGMAPSFTPTTSTLKFKRDRKITNKAELTRLQREFESHTKEIERIQDSKVIAASVASYGIGILGTVFMVASVFAITAATPLIPLCIIFAVPGVVGWVMPYFLFNRIKAKKTEQVMPMIDSKYDAIYELCEKASRLSIC